MVDTLAIRVAQHTLVAKLAADAGSALAVRRTGARCCLLLSRWALGGGLAGWDCGARSDDGKCLTRNASLANRVAGRSSRCDLSLTFVDVAENNRLADEGVGGRCKLVDPITLCSTYNRGDNERLMEAV